jgi:hypothetical protein
MIILKKMFAVILKNKNGEGVGFSLCTCSHCFFCLWWMGHLCQHLQVMSVDSVVHSSVNGGISIEFEKSKIAKECSIKKEKGEFIPIAHGCLLLHWRSGHLCRCLLEISTVMQWGVTIEWLDKRK